MPTPSDDSAELRVVVTTARGALPVEGASVTVSTAADETGARELLYAVTTDSGGMTPPMSLPTPPRANSMTPDGGLPYAVYTVEVAHPGFTPGSALHVTMFSGVPAVLPVALTPLPENQSSAPTDLTATGEPQVLYHAEPDFDPEE
nr:carboxypeptidase-like regulatory domain-containing protein [uncultured Agathobaculum sp.]